jgi:hypothetical protein
MREQFRDWIESLETFALEVRRDAKVTHISPRKNPKISEVLTTLHSSVIAQGID